MYSKRKKPFFSRKRYSKRVYSRSKTKSMFDPQHLLYYQTRTQRFGSVLNPKTEYLESRKGAITEKEISDTIDLLNSTRPYSYSLIKPNLNPLFQNSFYNYTTVPFSSDSRTINPANDVDETLHLDYFDDVKRLGLPFWVDALRHKIKIHIPTKEHYTGQWTLQYSASIKAEDSEFEILHPRTLTFLKDSDPSTALDDFHFYFNFTNIGIKFQNVVDIDNMYVTFFYPELPSTNSQVVQDEGDIKSHVVFQSMSFLDNENSIQVTPGNTPLNQFLRMIVGKVPLNPVGGKQNQVILQKDVNMFNLALSYQTRNDFDPYIEFHFIFAHPLYAADPTDPVQITYGYKSYFSVAPGELELKK